MTTQTFLVSIEADPDHRRGSATMAERIREAVADGFDHHDEVTGVAVAAIEHKPEDFTQIMAAVTQARDIGTGVLRMIEGELRSMPPGLEQTLGSWVLEHLAGAELAYDRDPAGFGYGPLLDVSCQIPLSQEQVRQIRPFWERHHGVAENEGELRPVSMETEVATADGTITATHTRHWVCRNERTSRHCTPVDHRPTTGRGDFERPSVHADCGWVHVDQ